MAYPITYGPTNACFLPFVVNMSTAIAVVLTEHGIAIAADGLDCEVGTYRVRNACARKIFPVSDGGMLAYTLAGIVGTIKPDSDEILFDFADEIPKALTGLTTAGEPTLYDFVEAVATRLLTAFKSAIKDLPYVREQVTRILFVGYYDGPEAVELKFEHSASGKTFYRLTADVKLRLDVPIGYGSDPIWDRLGQRDDPDFYKYRPRVSFDDPIAIKGLNIVKHCVLAHYGPIAQAIDPEVCRAIGGQLHAAQITLDKGFYAVKLSTEGDVI